MTKIHSAKYKIDRRLSVNLWGRAKSPYNVRQSRPGQHGAALKKRSDYGMQLIAKQKLRFYYANIGEKQFRKYYEEATRRIGDTSENLISLLESRLDAVIYRMKLVPTMFAARQFISHCHILVNGKKVNISSYQLQPGDVIEVREKSKKIPTIAQAIESAEREVPDYVEVNHTDLKGTFVRVPKFAEVPYPVKMEPNVVVEFYSR